MNNKGFTLIELIVTIALLAIIAVISFVSISGVLQESKVKDCDNLIINIKNATKDYFSDNRYSLNKISSYKVGGNDKQYLIAASVLTNTKYLSSPLLNPFDNTSEITSSTFISVTLKDDYTVATITIKSGTGDTAREVVCSNNVW